MPSNRRQINVRADDKTERLIAELLPAVSDALGLDVTVSDLFRLGMQGLAKKYLPPPVARDGKAPPRRRQG